MKKNKRNTLATVSGNSVAGSNQKRISQGGMIGRGTALPDVVLQMPEVFFFDLQKYMNAINAALSIDHSNRVRLYDMYESCRFDLHLSGILDKRVRAVTQRMPFEFQRDGVPDDIITPQLNSPWMKRFRQDIIMTDFWGYSLFQFYLDAEGNIRYDLINRKHYDPVRRNILKFQGDTDGLPVEAFPNMLFLGDERELGIFSELLIAVLYKRGDMSDWARFCNIFGMPIREYTYEAGDEEARKRLIQDARNQGSNAVYIHPKDSELKLVESGNKTGSSDLYKTFADYWDSKMSIRVLGNTLTTDAKETGTQALGTVHKEEEDDMNSCDRDKIVDILNFYLKPILANLGFNVEGGEFVYAKKEEVDTDKQIVIVEKLGQMGLPIDDDYLYNTFGIEKPANYEQMKAEKEAAKQALQQALSSKEDEATVPNGSAVGNDKGSNTVQKSFKQQLRSFFGLAPLSQGADSDF